MFDPNHTLDYEPLPAYEDLTHSEEPTRIVDRKNQLLRKRTIPYVKVKCYKHSVCEVTWELEEEM